VSPVNGLMGRSMGRCVEVVSVEGFRGLDPGAGAASKPVEDRGMITGSRWISGPWASGGTDGSMAPCPV
jgi:hypothetical protein